MNSNVDVYHIYKVSVGLRFGPPTEHCVTETTRVWGWRPPPAQGQSPGQHWNPFLPTGRIDRKIEFPLPDEKTKKRIFQIHTSRMTLADDVTLDDLIMAKDDLSGADIKVSPWPGVYLSDSSRVGMSLDIFSQMTRTSRKAWQHWIWAWPAF